MVESSALLKRRTPKGYRGFESLPHRHVCCARPLRNPRFTLSACTTEIRTPFDWWGASRARVKSEAQTPEPRQSLGNPSLTASSWAFGLMARQRGIIVPDENITLRVPEVTLGLVGLCGLLLLPFNSSETFPLLISHAARLGAFATDKQCSARE